jgi:hypothetical protein
MRNRWWEPTLSCLLGVCSPSFGQTDRPSELPDFLPTPEKPLTPKSEPKLLPPKRDPNRPEYDPSYNYLPDRNPGSKLPPCPCLPLGRTWFDAQYFLGTTRSDTVPALVLAGGNGDPQSPGTQVLTGQSGLTRRFRSGLRVDFGGWLDRCQNWGLEGHFFNLETNQVDRFANSTGTTVLSRPFMLPGTGPASDLIAGPGVGSGAVQVSSPLSYLSGDVNARHNLKCEDQYRVDFLVGYRFLRLDEQLFIESSQQGLGSSRRVRDEFSTGNVFHGAQVGLTGEYRWERFYIDATGKVAFGTTSEELDIRGATRTQSTGGDTQLNRGLLTAPSNIGRTRQSSYSVVPETNLVVGYQLTDHLRASVGYTFLYISNVTRPGQAIDTTVAPLEVGLRPTRLDATTDFWVQGITFGMEMRY